MPHVTHQKDKSVLKLDHDLVASTVPEVKKQLKELVDQGSKVAIDLNEVNMVDSTGIGLLMAAHNSLQEHNHVLEVINVSNDIHQLFKTMRLDKRFEIS